MSAARSVGVIRGRSQARANVRVSSAMEETFALHVRVNNLPEPQREYRFHPTRQWRTDFAWPTDRLLVELEGGIYTNGRHTRGSGYERDVEKYNAAVLMGFTLLRFTPSMVRSGAAIERVIEFLKREAK